GTSRSPRRMTAPGATADANAAVPDTRPEPRPGRRTATSGVSHEGRPASRALTRWRSATGLLAAPQAPGAQQPEGEQAQRCPSAHVRQVLAVECPCVTLRVLGRRIPLASFRSALPRATPEHRVALMRKAITVSEKVAAQHRRPP